MLRNNNRLIVYNDEDETRHGWFVVDYVDDGHGTPRASDGDFCKPKNLAQNITAEVKAALAPPTPSPVIQQSPAEQAEQAQQRADCLKLAVKNPSIVCKP